MVVALEHHAVHLTKVFLIFSHQFVDVSCDQHGNAILFGSTLKPSRHVHAWTQVTSVNLVLRSNGALNRPSNMQPKSHLDSFVVFDSVLKVLVILVLEESVRFGDFGDHFDER